MAVVVADAIIDANAKHTECSPAKDAIAVDSRAKNDFGNRQMRRNPL
jgi:hypothetical protein